MFGGPSFGGARAVVVGPDDLVLKTVASEDLVEHDLAVVDLAVVDVEEERAGGGEDAVRLDHAGAEKAEEVVEVDRRSRSRLPGLREPRCDSGVRRSRRGRLLRREWSSSASVLCRLPVLKGGST